METRVHSWRSTHLNQEMEVRTYGHGGQPLLGFPSFGGRVWDLEGFGLVGALEPLIEAGRVWLVAADGIDRQSWGDRSMPLSDRAKRHEAFDGYLTQELAPFVVDLTGRATLWTTGCSMGAYHAANIFFRHPDLFNAVIGLSGVYRPPSGEDGQIEDVYFNSPLDFLPDLTDPWYLDRYRASRLIFAVGQGAWEEPCLADTRQLESVLAAKGIPAWFDYWGYDVDHEWAWWRTMLPYFLEHLNVA